MVRYGETKQTIKVKGDYWEHSCTRCETVWYSKNESPGRCANQKCNSPYWDRAITRPEISKNRKKK